MASSASNTRRALLDGAIAQAFAKAQGHPRTTAPRRETLWCRIGTIISAFTDTERSNCLKRAGYGQSA